MVGESTVTLETGSPGLETSLCHLLAVCFGQVSSPLRVSVYPLVKKGIKLPNLLPRAMRGLNGTLLIQSKSLLSKKDSSKCNFPSLILV